MFLKKISPALFWLFVTVALPPGTLCAQSATDSPEGPQLHAKSQQEADDYRSARAAGNGAALEQAARAFAAQYPKSELREYLFDRAMHQYQRENNSAGMLTMGEMVLTLNPNDSLALVLTATALADNLSPGDPDRERKLAEIKKNAGRAVTLLETGSKPNASAASQAALYKDTLLSMAFAALGMMRLKNGDYAEAEKDLKTAADLTKIRPDPYVWYHLALAQDHRKRYPAALNSVEQALQLASSNPDLQKMAEAEHDRLNRLTGRSKQSPDSGGAQPPQ
jgi:tetratricopeptide (TPR) repeat protein